jgi:hypothetical protein
MATVSAHLGFLSTSPSGSEPVCLPSFRVNSLSLPLIQNPRSRQVVTDKRSCPTNEISLTPEKSGCAKLETQLPFLTIAGESRATRK